MKIILINEGEGFLMKKNTTVESVCNEGVSKRKGSRN